MTKILQVQYVLQSFSCAIISCQLTSFGDDDIGKK